MQAPDQTRDRWKRVRALLEVLIDLPAAEQEAGLAEHCGGDGVLEAEVRRLLAADRGSDTAGTRIEPAVLGSGSERLVAPAECIGPYTLRRCLGSGGMGSVWLAVESDGDFRRRVAIKLLHPSLGRDELVARFQRERQVLANFDHPGIARLIDGGVSAGGLPYLVMEYVEGERIDRWCEQQGLDLPARLELFRKVCDAVQHAHQHLVVHRDLKPGNILVTSGGAPKLLDFGIAKVLDPEKRAQSEVTMGVMRFFTPSYASPEQARGLPVTTASDVYSLGVLLYQLLTGRLPHRIPATSSQEIARILTEVEPLRPSVAVLQPAADGDEGTGDTSETALRRRGTTRRRLSRTLAGDLDRIVLKALRPEPLRRYATVHELSEDVRRFLAGEPVSARPDRLGYRAARFVRRNRVAVGLASLLLVALIGGLVAAVVLYRRAERARDAAFVAGEQARERARELEALTATLEQRNDELKTQRGELTTALAEGRELGEGLAEARELAERRFQDVRRFTTTLLFDLYARVAPLEGATEASGLLLSTGLEYLDRLALESADDPTVRRELAEAYLRLAGHQAGAFSANLGQIDAALVSLERAATLAGSLAEAGEIARGDRTLLAMIEMSRGDIQRRTKQDRAALESYQRAVAAVEALEHDPAAGVRGLYGLAGAVSRVAEWHSDHAAMEEAEDGYTRAIALLEGVLRLAPGDVSGREDLSVACMKLGSIQVRRGNADGFELVREAIAQADELAQENPANYLVKRQAMVARFTLGGLLWSRGELDPAREVFREVLELSQRLYDANPDNALARRDLVLASLSTTGLCAKAERWSEALEAAQRAVPVARTRAEHAPEDWIATFELAQLHLESGRARLGLGRELEAGADLAQVAELLEAQGEPEPGDAVPCRYYGETALQLGKLLARNASDEVESDDSSWSSLTSARRWLERSETALRALVESDQAFDSDRADLAAAREEIERIDGLIDARAAGLDRP